MINKFYIIYGHAATKPDKMNIELQESKYWHHKLAASYISHFTNLFILTCIQRKKTPILSSINNSKYDSNEYDNGNFEEIKRQLEKKIYDLENSLKSTKNEHDRLNEKSTQIQMEYLEAVHNKDQLIEEKHIVERKIQSLEIKLEDISI